MRRQTLILDLNENEPDFYAGCSKKMFWVITTPVLPFSEQNMDELADQIIKSQATVTGVQPKLSLHLASAIQPNLAMRFTIVGMWGGFIKPYKFSTPNSNCIWPS